MKKKKTTDAVAILEKLFIKGDPERLAAIEAEREKIRIAEQVYALRKERGLTQKQLAEIIGTTQSVISRLESTDYESERIETLQKLAAALNCRLEVQFVPKEELTLTKQGEDQEAFQSSENGCIWFQDHIPVGDCNWDWQYDGQKPQYG
ncbi:MAG: helix-turn-helix transcriptional regulator [Phycisphaerae bacterium]|nr:helix-turn-helix transcriptional regulator [Phycisphaerae bacterium]